MKKANRAPESCPAWPKPQQCERGRWRLVTFRGDLAFPAGWNFLRGLSSSPYLTRVTVGGDAAIRILPAEVTNYSNVVTPGRTRVRGCGHVKTL